MDTTPPMRLFTYFVFLWSSNLQITNQLSNKAMFCLFLSSQNPDACHGSLSSLSPVAANGPDNDHIRAK